MGETERRKENSSFSNSPVPRFPDSPFPRFALWDSPILQNLSRREAYSTWQREVIAMKHQSLLTISLGYRIRVIEHFDPTI